MARLILPFVLCFVGSLTLLPCSSARSTSYYSGYAGAKAPPAVAANGSGSRYGSRTGFSGGSVEAPKASEPTKAASPLDKKSTGPAMSAWGIIAIIITLCLSLMGVYYFTLFYPLLCQKERKYDVMDLGSQ